MVVAAGQLIAGRYRLESPIGEGAMAAVWRAHDETLRRAIAIKFLFVRGTRDPEAMVEQFLREARIAASVQHRNVIHTVDFGTVDDLQPFMVMELLSGESLGDRMARDPPLSVEQVIHLASLTLRGLSAVHDAGIVHRDLKPHNIFLQRDADTVYPKILDFGISRSLEQGPERQSAIATQEGMIVGTPDYMAPEQARGEAAIDKRADIYGMGVILYEGLTGRLPFQAETIGDLIVQIVTEEPPKVADLRPDIAPALSNMVAQAMAKDRTRRFGDARAMRRALLAAAEQGLPPVRRVALSTPPAPAPSPARGAAAAAAATWGDFEGLGALSVDDGPPGPADAAPGPADAVRDLEFDLADAAPKPKRARPGRPAAKAKRPADLAPPNVPAGAALDLFDPMGQREGAPDVDLDYERIRGEGGGAKVVASRQPRLVRPPVARQRSRGRYGYLVLPAIALALVAWMLMGSPQDGRGADAALQRVAAGTGVSPASDTTPEPPGPGAPAASPRHAAGGGQLQRERRDNPKAAPVHMRDVVF